MNIAIFSKPKTRDMKLALLALLLTALPATAQKQNALVVLTKNHTSHIFVLKDKPEVKFQGAELVITSEQATASFSVSDILRFTYEEEDVSKINELSDPESELSYRDGVLVISQLKKGSSVSVLTLDGKVVSQLNAGHTGTYRLSLSSLPAGGYTVKTGTVNFKIAKR